MVKVWKLDQIKRFVMMAGGNVIDRFEIRMPYWNRGFGCLKESHSGRWRGAADMYGRCNVSSITLGALLPLLSMD
jgi:hypothetical protein